MFSVFKLESCLPGMLVRITKNEGELLKEEIFEGYVKELKKPNKYVLYVDVKLYTKSGRVRDRWKRKVVMFANSSKLKIENDQDYWSTAKRTAREFRKAYRGARTILTVRRTEANAHFDLLGVTNQVSRDDLNRIRRAGVRDSHPDILEGRLNRGDITEEQFSILMKKSKLFSQACAWVEDFINKRDGNV